MKFNIISVLKVNDLYFEIGDIISYILNDDTQWWGELKSFGEECIIVKVDGLLQIINMDNIKMIWK